MLRSVMIVDDNDADLLFSRIILERSGIAGRVILFEQAREALAYLQGPSAGEVDLILLDINMPGMDGFEWLAEYEPLRDAGRARAGVVMLTSSPDPADRQRASGFDSVFGYLIKPLDPDEAVALARHAPGAAP